MKNIDLFNYFAAQALAELYANFPVPTTLSVDCAVKQLLPSLKDLYEEGIEHNGSYWLVPNPNRPHEHLLIVNQFWIETIKWLRSAGYLTTDQDMDPSNDVARFLGVIVTPKGLEVLNARIDALDPGRSIGTLLTNVATGTGEEAGRTFVKKVVESAFAVGVKMIL